MTDIINPNVWQPASGYTTKSGKSKWRCWNASLPAYNAALRRRDGKTWLCNSYEAAQRKCKALNARLAP